MDKLPELTKEEKCKSVTNIELIIYKQQIDL